MERIHCLQHIVNERKKKKCKENVFQMKFRINGIWWCMRRVASLGLLKI